jgi:hypothetical protein
MEEIPTPYAPGTCRDFAPPRVRWLLDRPVKPGDDSEF